MNKSTRSRHRRSPPQDDPRANEPPPLPAFRRWSARNCLIAALLAGGCALRVALPTHAAVEHFDEGVYASNIWFNPQSGDAYPLRHLYAPPLVPLFIEWSIIGEQVVAPPVGGPSSLGVMLPNMLMGCAMLLAVWRVTRTWLGDEAALGALTLAAFSETHALYSRTALTEVGLLLSLLVGLYCLERVGSKSRGQLKWIAAAGVVIACGWWCKYNGWMPLMIGFVAVVAQLICVPAGRRRGVERIVQGTVVALLALSLWSPYLFSLQRVGGYAGVMSNHRKYIVGLSGWFESLSTHWQNLRWFDGWLSCLAPAVALVLLACWQRLRPGGGERDPMTRSQASVLAASSAGLIGSACWLGSAAVLAGLGVGGIVAFWFRPADADQEISESDADADPHLGGWLVASWFVVMFVLTPLYSPYPRLALPWLCSTWIAGGAGIAFLVRRCLGPSIGQDARPFIAKAAWLVVLLVGIGGTLAKSSQLTSRGVTAWQDRGGLKQVAERIADRLSDENAVVFVYGEPALFYHLRAAGVAAAPGINLGAPVQIPVGTTAYLVAGLHAEQDADFAGQLAEFGRRHPGLEQIDSLRYQPSDLVLLNNSRPAEIAALKRQARVLWYRLN